MDKVNITWKIFSVYMLIIILMLFAGSAFSQVKVIQFNAAWNDKNTVEWIKDLSDCDVKYIDIAQNTDAQKKHEIVVVPTIIVFKDGEEVKRFQADISFTMKATREEVQEIIDEQLMSDF
tara:strand:- start:2167 stop:2526 length:360 start_codon:yes stop_codon:yes gene_type:complete